MLAPRLLAKPSRLLDAQGKVPPQVSGLTRSLAVRDAALALALLTAPAGRATRALTAARVVSDAADAVWFWRMVPHPQRLKISGAAAAWAVVELTLGVRSEA